ncbi:hypothetical protein [Microbacterium resistens]|uniref:hypothetical protein n=1 Tax=Microbacterium resistens TaxID=156977 RepID=UPI00367162C8
MRPHKTSPRRWVGIVAAVAVAAALLSASPATAAVPAALTSDTAAATTALPQDVPAAVRPAADLSQFRAGNIISDRVFTDAGTMTAGQIQSFFEGKVSSCRSGYTCLKDFRISSVNRPADSYCRGYSGASNELASTIIARVAQSCGINPQVLVVMLQKEQGLVTHTWPSQWRYDAALGQGCPDDAPCDPSFVGFFHQIYGAARQMKIYLEGEWFTWFAPGNTWNILYNPDRGCGSSPVYIENAATSALYYYTPYQPNAAALRAGYGEGDGCSAYGNRNFYNYFTDWFGSTQGGGGPTGPVPKSGLVQASGQEAIYLIMSGVRHHVVSGEDLAAFTSRLGGVAVTSASALGAVPEGRPITRYVHDPRSGTLYLLERDGTKHAFVNAAQVALFGYDFGSYVNLDAATSDRFTKGAAIGTFFRSGTRAEVYLYQDGKRRHVANQEIWRRVSKGTSGYVASMTPSAAAKIPVGKVVLFANRLIRGAGADPIYLSLVGERLLHIPNVSLATEFGAPPQDTLVPASSLSANAKAPGTLRPIVLCGDQAYVAASGTVYPISTRSSFSAMEEELPEDESVAPDDDTADTTEETPESGGLAVRTENDDPSGTDGPDAPASSGADPATPTPTAPSDAETPTPTETAPSDTGTPDPTESVPPAPAETTAPAPTEEPAAPEDGDEESPDAVDGDEPAPGDQDDSGETLDAELRATAYAGITPTRLTAAECGTFRKSRTTLTGPLFVQPKGWTQIYMIGGGKLRHVQSIEDLRTLNGNRALTVLAWAPDTARWLGFGSSVLPEKSFVRFEGRDEIYRYTGGALHHVRSVETLIRLGGGRAPAVQVLPGDRLGGFTVGSPLLTDRKDFVRFQGSDAVYYWQSGRLRHVLSGATLIRLNGGTPPMLLDLPAAYKRDYPVGTDIP